MPYDRRNVKIRGTMRVRLKFHFLEHDEIGSVSGPASYFDISVSTAIHYASNSIKCGQVDEIGRRVRKWPLCTKLALVHETGPCARNWPLCTKMALVYEIDRHLPIPTPLPVVLRLLDL
jgi:hypothetical protein